MRQELIKRLVQAWCTINSLEFRNYNTETEEVEYLRGGCYVETRDLNFVLVSMDSFIRELRNE